MFTEIEFLMKETHLDQLFGLKIRRRSFNYQQPLRAKGEEERVGGNSRISVNYSTSMNLLIRRPVERHESVMFGCQLGGWSKLNQLIIQ